MDDGIYQRRSAQEKDQQNSRVATRTAFFSSCRIGVSNANEQWAALQALFLRLPFASVSTSEPGDNI
jgi:hypothetical protein